MKSSFRIAHPLSYAALGIAVALLLSPPMIQAGKSSRFAGWGGDGKVTARFLTGIARWDSKAREVSIGFTPAPPTNGDQESFLKTGWWGGSMKQRGMSLGMIFQAGEAAASLCGLHRYWVAFYHYPGNPYPTPLTLNFNAEGSALYLSKAFRGWGWQELSGDLRPGGRIRGHVAFDQVYEYKKKHIGPIPYRWDLEFDTIMH